MDAKFLGRVIQYTEDRAVTVKEDRLFGGVIIFLIGAVYFWMSIA